MKIKIITLIASILYTSLSLSSVNAEDKWNGDHYEKHSHMQQESAFALLKTITFKGNESVLDIGCGDGKITATIAKQVPQGHVVGLDISPNMIHTAQQTFVDRNNLCFIVADANDFILNPKFNYVFSFYALHWVSDLASSLKSIKNVLRPGGKAFIKIGTTQDNCPIQSFFNNLDPNGKWGAAKAGRKKTFHGDTTAEKFSLALESAGFKNKNVQIIYESFFYENFDALTLWFMGWVPHCIQLGQEKSLEFCQELVEHLYVQNHKQKHESFIFTFPILQAEAW
ncbi:MAG: class I SAM-dependent methyltransferase [bacterium]